jgi:hypothetical protein
MKIKFNTNLLVNIIVISVVIFYAIIFISMFYFTNSNTIFHGKYEPGDTYTWNNELPEIDPSVSTELPYYKYLDQKKRVDITRRLKNGEFLDMAGAQIGGLIGISGGMLCDTCTINHGKWDIPGVKQYYVQLPGWKIKNATIKQDNIDSVMFYVEHKQSYIRKAIVDKIVVKKNGSKNYQGHMADVPVKFRYNTLQNYIMIPISEQLRNIVNGVLLGIVILIVAYIFYLIAAFLKFIVDVSKGLSFTNKNIFRLKLISLSLLGGPILSFLLNLLMYPIFSSYFTSDVALNTKAWSNYWIVIVVGIVFLLLFKAFRQGKMLKDEQDLTV